MNDHTFSIDFIGVGAPKTGTTWAAKCLAEHPEICFSTKKEINFFNKTYQFYHKEKPWNFEKGIGWYAQFFEGCPDTQITGEFSVNYFYDAETPQLMREMFPDAKVIIILRNPVDQVYSNYLHINSQYDLPPFEQMVEEKNGFVPYGYYSRYLQRFFDAYPRDQILVALYNDIQTQPKKFLEELYTFLGVDATFVPPSAQTVINATGPKTIPEGKLFFSLRNATIRLFKKHKLMRKKWLMKPVQRIDNWICEHILPLLKKRRSTYKPLSGDLRKSLLQLYATDIETVEHMIERDLGFWRT
jgi:hypothetical protein